MLAVVLALLEHGLAVLFRLSPHDGFAIYRDRKGRTIKSGTSAPRASSPQEEAERLLRASAMLERLP